MPSSTTTCTSLLRTRPDVLAQWSDEEVARRRLSLFPGQRVDEFLGQPTQNSIDALVRAAGRIAEVRQRWLKPLPINCASGVPRRASLDEADRS